MCNRTFSFSRTGLSRFVHLFAVVAIGLSLIPANSQEKSQTKKPLNEDDVIKVNSNLVNFDVTVRDKKGKVVTDLKADDFTITENGVKQKIEFFDATLAGPRENEGPNTSSSNPTSPPPTSVLPRNVVSLVLDGQTTESTNLKPVRDGIINYVRNRITNDDSVALFAIAGGLQLLQPFTQDKEKLITAVERTASTSSGPKLL